MITPKLVIVIFLLIAFAAMICILVQKWLMRKRETEFRCSILQKEATFTDYFKEQFVEYAVTKPYRGTYSERTFVRKLLLEGFKTTAIYHDLYVETAPNNYSQIDIVLATDVGLIVIEVKDYIGWIFGKGSQDNWTQVTRYGRNKNYFPNPFKQNAGHIRALRQLSEQFHNIPMYNLVLFTDRAIIKDVKFIPANSYIACGSMAIVAVREIIERNPPANYSDRWEIANKLKQCVEQGESMDKKLKHIVNIHEMLGEDRKFL